MLIAASQPSPFQNTETYSPTRGDDASRHPAIPQSPPSGNRPSDPTGQQQTEPETENQTQTEQDIGSNAVSEASLTQEELRVVDQLQQIDAEVRRHEMAHIAAAGGLALSGANFSYTRGPDGKNYAVGGEVSIDTSPVPGDPQATIRKMQQVRSAALAPASPSSQDVKVASHAASQAAKAVSEMMMLQAEERAKARETQAFGDMKHAAGSYERVNNLPETDTSTFQVAV